jgi:ActR/RegA family two-component response regulator
MEPKHSLLSIIELGGYPDFTALYERLGFEVVTVVSTRKALAVLKQTTPRVIVAEFNYQSDFRDRTSSLESLLAVVQQLPGTRVVVLYDPDQVHQLDRLRARFPIHEALPHPVDARRLEAALKRLAISTE